MRIPLVGSVGTLAFLTAVAAAPQAAHEEASRRVMAGRPGYDTGGLHNAFMGSGYRKVWVTPIDFAVLDLTTFAGGLRPVKQVGSMQSIGLALEGQDGKSYTFRTADKDPTRILPPEWKGTVPAHLFQDATTANHPGVGFVVPPLAETAGILHVTPRYVFMPDDPALGEFRATFGGKPGTIEEYPLPGPEGAPGFAGATGIVSTQDLWKRHLAGTARVDGRALLRARLFDLWIGDWDRHNKQWRWLQRGEGQPFEPLPEDRDQAFSKFGGLLLSMARATHPKFMDWKDYYENFEGFMTQGGEVDRWLLSEMDRQAFAETAADLAARLTDAVIDDAVRRLPPEWYAIDGESLAQALRKRRSTLPAAAGEFYARLARRVDVHGTDAVDSARARRLDDGRLELAGTAGAPWFRRTFDPRETREVRLYLYGGADRVATGGPAGGPITFRVIGGAGADTLDDSASGGTRFHDFEGPSTVAKGPGTHEDGKPWERRPAKPEETAWLEWRDWGSRTIPRYQLWWEPDTGVVLAGGFTRQSWGFRKSPYASLQGVQLQYSTLRQKLKFNYDGEFRRQNSPLSLVVDAQASGLENLNYFGVGNDSSAAPPPDRDDGYFDADSDTYRITVGPHWNVSRTFEAHVSAEAKWTRTPVDQDSFVGDTEPYGTGDFGQVGVRAGFDLDTRGHRLAGTVGDQFRAEGKPALTGIRLKGAAFYYPEAWDARADFSGLEGELRGFLVGTRAMAAARVGGRRVFGDYPWFESAFVGGSKNLRGYRKNRFAGDGSLYGSVEARLWLFRGSIIAPGRFGIFGLADAGRVFLEEDTSDGWHASYGGGVFFQMLTLNSVFHAAAAHGDEGTRIYVDYGFAF